MAEDEEFDKLRQKFKVEIEQDKAYESFLAGYMSPDWVINNFATFKAAYQLRGNRLEESQKWIENNHEEICWYIFKDIQHKKLFDLQCKWRAEEIGPLPEIFTTMDFYIVGFDILSYKGIEPVTEEELAFYIEYLQRGDEHIDPHSDLFMVDLPNFQDYDDTKSMLKTEGEVWDDYFRYHNLMFGGHMLLSLPNIKEEKERLYRDLVRGKEEEPEPASKPAKEKKDDLPFFGFNDLVKMANACGEKPLARYIKSRLDYQYRHGSGMVGWADLYLHHATRAGIEVKTESGGDWEYALVKTVKKHRFDCVLEILPKFHEQYKSGRKSPDTIDPNYTYLREMFRKSILDGREIMGEPRNFDF